MARDGVALWARAREHPVYDSSWRNTPDMYTQTKRVDEFSMDIPQDKALILLLEKYNEAFDQDWYFYLCTRGRGKGLFVRRVPIWQTGKKMPAEKHRPLPRIRQQKALLEVSA